MPSHAPLQRILLVGDSLGLPELIARVPASRIVALVAASNRPQYHDVLREEAARAGVPLLIQPRADSADYGRFVQAMAALQPDSLLCHSYAMRIRHDVLALVRGRAFNVHAALLPRHRGPNPIQWALIHGDAHTGVTLHVMDEEFDRGAIVMQESLVIDAADTWQSLAARVRVLTTDMLDRAIPALLRGEWNAMPQDEARAVRNPRIGPQSLPIDLTTMTDQQVVDLIRAQVAPLAGAFLEGSNGTQRFPEALSLNDVARLREATGV